MPENLYAKELLIFKEMTVSSPVLVDVLTRLLLEKGVFTEHDFSERSRKNTTL